MSEFNLRNSLSREDLRNAVDLVSSKDNKEEVILEHIENENIKKLMQAISNECPEVKFEDIYEDVANPELATREWTRIAITPERISEAITEVKSVGVRGFTKRSGVETKYRCASVS